MRHSQPPAPALAILTLIFTTVALTALLAACGGGTTAPDTSAPSLTITSQTTATSATYHLTGKTSDNVGATRITYSVDGGPTQTVDLSGGTFDITITLQAGQNTLDVAVFDAAGNEKTATFKVTYTPPPTTGSLDLAITGLPSGVDASVHITGMGLNTTVKAGGTLADLAAGSYTVVPNDVADDPFTYGGSPATQTLDVTAGGTSHASVAYQATTGAVNASVTGLPSGLAGATLKEQGGSGTVYHVDASTTLANMPPATYAITAPPLFASNGEWYGVENLSSNATIAVNAGPPAASLTLAYQVLSGDFDITISGAPSASVIMTDPGGTYGYYITLTASQLQKGLMAGPTGTLYRFTPRTVSDGSYHYDGPVVTATLQRGQTVPVNVSYAASDGAIAITWTGSIPSASTYGATIVDASGTTHTASAPASSSTATLVPYVAAGVATVTPDSFTVCVNRQSTLYSATVSPTATPSVAKGATTNLTIQYTGTVVAGAPPC